MDMSGRCRLILLVLALAVGQGLWAQQLSDSYYLDNPSWIEAEVWASDGDYHNRQQPVVDNPFEEYARYGFSFMDYSWRGESSSSLTTRLGRVPLQSPLERYPDYGVTTLLRYAGIDPIRVPSDASATGWSDLRGEVYDPCAVAEDGYSRLRVQLASRNYRLGAHYAAIRPLGEEGALRLGVGGRVGDDANIAGLYNNSLHLWLSANRSWTDGRGTIHTLVGGVGVSPTERSQRSWNTEEVFMLAGDPHYNSYWGWQGGKVRSSRVVGECVPTIYASWEGYDPYLLARANVSMVVRAGRRTRSSLDWASAPNPLPDYYGTLPSGQSDPSVALLAREWWLEGDERFTQVGWDELYHTNHLSREGVHYAMIDERSDLLSAVVDGALSLEGVEGASVGVRLAAHRSHNYSLAGDLLGGSALHPTFDLYDYHLAHTSWTLYGSFNRPIAVGYLSLAGEFGSQRVLFANSGARRNNDFTSVAVRSSWHHTTEGGSRLGAVAHYDRSAPYWEVLYGSPEGMVSTNPYATAQRVATLQLSASRQVAWVEIFATLYCRGEWGGGAAESFWNDLLGSYSSLLAGGLARCGAGVELSATARIPSTRITLEAHASLSSVGYLSDGVADIVDYHTGTPYVKYTSLNTRSLGASSSPRMVASLVGRYLTRRGWLVGGEVAVVGGRTLEPTLLFVTGFMESFNLTAEERLSLLPRRLEGATNVSLFVSRKWGPLSVSLSVRNLLNSTAPLSGAYQPSRLRVTDKEYQRTYSVHDLRGRHLYPRYAYLSVAYEF